MQNTITANETILQITDEGYMLPFIETPSDAKFSNNKFALTNSAFVQEVTEEMLLSVTTKQIETPPKVVNPLTVSTNSNSKKRLILDLKYVNDHLYIEKTKFDNWKCFKNYLLANKGYLFKFDLKNSYHHINIFEPHQTYLGFSCVFNSTTKYFIFTVLPFDLSTTPFVFTKVLRPLVKFWRFDSIKIACFVDGGLGIEYEFFKAC